MVLMWLQIFEKGKYSKWFFCQELASQGVSLTRLTKQMEFIQIKKMIAIQMKPMPVTNSFLYVLYKYSCSNLF